ncbi:phosphoribosyltransferase [Spiroplasma apis]|uniref:Hypoxanthine-guanine phosphoribosyltransferase n=1 Tax=Spiroplasma apis B31 TaxID=1276258 RepID=V5RLU2_SPIAP|nr:phosphoribosyltransferase family protein [Spiroplasma apis]AHB36825.1 hypoxanthine-guanine phosphoribosyltransferase [Spiroplasma apis B31]
MNDNQKLVTLITEEEIKGAIIKAATEYGKTYENQQLTIVAELSSSFVFVADLIRELPIDVTIQFFTKETTSDERKKINLGSNKSLNDKNVLIVTDILYEGNSLKNLYELIQKENPQKVELLALIEKDCKTRNFDLEVDSLFKIDDCFVVGYGLTYKESYRGLKGIYKINVNEE